MDVLKFQAVLALIIAVQSLIIIVLGQSLVEEADAPDIDEEEDFVLDCATNFTYQGEKFIRVSNESRFFYPKQYSLVRNPLESRTICLSMGLEPAMVESIDDFQALVSVSYYHDDKLNQQRLHFHIDGTDEDGDGIYTSLISGNKLPFQAFMMTRGREYFNETLKCLSITCSINADCHFRPRNCEDGPGVPLCQYPLDSECNFVYGGILITEELFPIGQDAQKVFYGSNVQKSWHEAMANCHALGMNLPSFVKHDPDESEDMLEWIHIYKDAIDLPMWMGQSWTAGKFKGQFGKKENFTFKTFFPESKQLWKYSDNEDHWEWLDNGVKDSKRETCLLAVSSNQTRPVLCDLPNYFLCWRERTDSDKDEDVEGGLDNLLLPPPEDLIGKGRHRTGSKKTDDQIDPVGAQDTDMTTAKPITVQQISETKQSPLTNNAPSEDDYDLGTAPEKSPNPAEINGGSDSEKVVSTTESSSPFPMPVSQRGRGFTGAANKPESVSKGQTFGTGGAPMAAGRSIRYGNATPTGSSPSKNKTAPPRPTTTKRPGSSNDMTTAKPRPSEEPRDMKLVSTTENPKMESTTALPLQDGRGINPGGQSANNLPPPPKQSGRTMGEGGKPMAVGRSIKYGEASQSGRTLSVKKPPARSPSTKQPTTEAPLKESTQPSSKDEPTTTETAKETQKIHPDQSEQSTVKPSKQSGRTMGDGGKPMAVGRSIKYGEASQSGRTISVKKPPVRSPSSKQSTTVAPPKESRPPSSQDHPTVDKPSTVKPPMQSGRTMGDGGKPMAAGRSIKYGEASQSGRTLSVKKSPAKSPLPKPSTTVIPPTESTPPASKNEPATTEPPQNPQNLGSHPPPTTEQSTMKPPKQTGRYFEEPGKPPKQGGRTIRYGEAGQTGASKRPNQKMPPRT